MEHCSNSMFGDLWKEAVLNTCKHRCKYIAQVKRKRAMLKLKRRGSPSHVTVHLLHIMILTYNQLFLLSAVLWGKSSSSWNNCCKSQLSALYKQLRIAALCFKKPYNEIQNKPKESPTTHRKRWCGRFCRGKPNAEYSFNLGLLRKGYIRLLWLNIAYFHLVKSKSSVNLH